jgi:hypothetical protein
MFRAESGFTRRVARGGSVHTVGKSSTSFALKLIFLCDILSFFFITPTYSEDTLTTALTAYCKGEYTSARNLAYAFDIPRSTSTKRLPN